MLSFFLTLILLVYWNMHLGSKIVDLQKDVTETKQEVAKYEKINKKIAQIKKKLEILERKTNVIRRLEKGRFQPVIMLESMSDKVIAKRMWFTGFQDRPKQTIINGVALDNKTIADFMTRLEGTGLFRNVQLKTIQKKMIRGSGLKQFRIVCNKKGPKKKPGKKPPNKKK